MFFIELTAIVTLRISMVIAGKNTFLKFKLIIPLEYFMNILFIYLLIINIIAIIITIYDKLCAIGRRWRVKENTLLLISALGGSVAMYITMQIIRHKTRHLKFMLGIPIIIIVQLLIAFIVWRVVNG